MGQVAHPLRELTLLLQPPVAQFPNPDWNGTCKAF